MSFLVVPRGAARRARERVCLMSMTNLVCDFSCNWLVFPFAVASEAEWLSYVCYAIMIALYGVSASTPPVLGSQGMWSDFIVVREKAGRRGACRLRKKSEHVLTKATPTAGNAACYADRDGARHPLEFNFLCYAPRASLAQQSSPLARWPSSLIHLGI